MPTLAAVIPGALTQRDDALLMADVQRGDHAAFAALVKRHHGRCYRLAWHILNDRGEAEDATQEAFLKVWKQARTFAPGRGQFSGWLTRIVSHCALDGRRVARRVTTLEPEAEALLEDDRPGPDRLAESREVQQLMAAMPARQRAALSLFYLEGCSMNEVADAMGSNIKSVESLLSRGRLALRTLIQTCEPDLKA